MSETKCPDCFALGQRLEMAQQEIMRLEAELDETERMARRELHEMEMEHSQELHEMELCVAAAERESE